MRKSCLLKIVKNISFFSIMFLSSVKKEKNMSEFINVI